MIASPRLVAGGDNGWPVHGCGSRRCARCGTIGIGYCTTRRRFRTAPSLIRWRLAACGQPSSGPNPRPPVECVASTNPTSMVVGIVGDLSEPVGSGSSQNLINTYKGDER